MAQLWANNATTTLAADIAAGDLSLSIAAGDGAKFPAPGTGDYFLATLYTTDGSGNITADEIVKVTARAGDTFTIVRAQEGTAAQAWSAATAKLMLSLTAGPTEGIVRSLPGMQRAGRWSTPVCSTSDFGSFGVGSLVLVPFFVPPGGASYDRIGIETNTGTAGASCALGIYDADGAGLPSTLLVDGGTVDTSPSGVATESVTISATLKGGRVWLAALPLGSTFQVRRNLTPTPVQISCADQSEALGSTQPVGYLLSGQSSLPADLTGAAIAATNQTVRIALRSA